MDVQASGAATALELGPEWPTSFFLPLIFGMNILLQSEALFDADRPARFLGHAVLLLVNAAGLAGALLMSRTRLRISGQGVELASAFRRRFYPFSEMQSGFEAVQRKLAPGFDICFQAQGRRVRLGRFDAVDATLLALLNAYKARAG